MVTQLGPIEPGVFVFDLQVALEAVLRPQHHVMGIVPEFRTGRQGHALRAVRHGAHFAVEKPLFLPILRARIGKHFRPRSAAAAFSALSNAALSAAGLGFGSSAVTWAASRKQATKAGKPHVSLGVVMEVSWVWWCVAFIIFSLAYRDVLPLPPQSRSPRQRTLPSIMDT